MNKLLKIFNVKSYQELVSFIKENPDDSRVQELKEISSLFNIDFEEGKLNE